MTFGIVVIKCIRDVIWDGFQAAETKRPSMITEGHQQWQITYDSRSLLTKKLQITAMLIHWIKDQPSSSRPTVL